MNHGALSYRDVSCFCLGVNNFCSCYEVNSFHFPRAAHTQIKTADTVGPLHAHSLETAVATEQTAENVSCVHVDKAQFAGAKITASHSLCPIDSDNISSLIGQHCVVCYNNKPYPGRIIEVDETDVKVACMHCVGNRYHSNRQTVRDECFYSFDDVKSLYFPEVHTASYEKAEKFCREIEQQPVTDEETRAKLLRNAVLAFSVWHAIEEHNAVVRGYCIR